MKLRFRWPLYCIDTCYECGHNSWGLRLPVWRVRPVNPELLAALPDMNQAPSLIFSKETLFYVGREAATSDAVLTLAMHRVQADSILDTGIAEPWPWEST